MLRSVDIDSQLENNAETALGLIHDTLRRLRVAIHKLKKANFQHVVIATDHGFFLNVHAEAGDVCTKPAGTWINAHERTLCSATARRTATASFYRPRGWVSVASLRRLPARAV